MPSKKELTIGPVGTKLMFLKRVNQNPDSEGFEGYEGVWEIYLFVTPNIQKLLLFKRQVYLTAPASHE